ncbi:MAG TPA: hypothetical protein VEL76_18405 [Gemmataceae bacterium]|nr:hypothetical protein [Gemmataceae bacterium]
MAGFWSVMPGVRAILRRWLARAIARLGFLLDARHFRPLPQALP